jgi:Protein of unknown function (DUF3014)
MNQRTIWTIAALLFAAIVAGVYWWQLPPPPPKAPPVVAAPTAAPLVAAPASAASAIQFPIEAVAQAPQVEAASAGGTSGNLADALVASLGRQAVLEFLNVDAFAHRVAATVDNLARTHAPARLWPVHPAAGRFATLATSDSTLVAAENSKRYTTFVQWVESLDMRRIAALYRQLYPNFQRAYEELGYPGRYFNDRMVFVIDHLLETPLQDEPMAVKLADIKGPIQPTRPWVMIEFADPQLEARSAGQKLLLRTGKANAQRLKVKLRELRAALVPTVTPR